MIKYILVFGFVVIAGCSNEAVKWVNAGTLVSVGPDVESIRSPDRLEEAIIGETKFNRTRVETTEGVYIVHGKIGMVQEGVPVTAAYGKSKSSDDEPDIPLYITFGGKRYKIVR